MLPRYGPEPGLLPAGILLLTITTGLASPARADGGFITSLFRDVWEPAQSALLLYDRQAGIEELILRVAFEGDTKDFGWIVPVPALPELEPADPEIFFDCSQLTEPVWRDGRSGWGCADGGYDRAPLEQNGDITIYGEETVGIYQSLTIGAGSASTLADSLEGWGYLNAENRPLIEEALAFYIDKSWFFVAMRIDSTSAADRRNDGSWFGGLEPILLRFETEEPVYPLRISALSTRGRNEVLLYVCDTHRMTFPGATTEYANDIDPQELGAIRRSHPHLGAVLVGTCYLTKLRKSFTAEEMSDDLILTPDASNEEFRPIHYSSGAIPADLILLGLTGIAFGLAGRRRGIDSGGVDQKSV